MIEVLEPATAEVMAEVPQAGLEEADAAVARAKAAFPAWRAVAPSDRSALLHRLAPPPQGERGGPPRLPPRAPAAPPARGAGGRAGGARAAGGAQRRKADRGRARRDGDGGRDLPLLRR